MTDVARHGINLSGGSFAAENLISRVGQSGIRFNAGSQIAASLYERNTIVDNAGQSVVDGKASGPNVCSDQLCGTSGLKFFYLTPTLHDGAAADAACAAGFHMATLWEIFETNAVEYDTVRGQTLPDSGQGPALFGGWIRTGTFGSDGNNPGAQGNCFD